MAVTVDGLYEPADTEQAWTEWGCNCGPAALAAVLQKDCNEVRSLFAGFDRRRYVNPTHMRDALAAARVPAWRSVGEWPQYGLVFLQIEGPWCNPGVPVGVAYRHTHWIASTVASYGGEVQQFVYDVNADQWAPFRWWWGHTWVHIAKRHKGCTGTYRARTVIEVPDPRAVRHIEEAEG
ncbi:MAG: hypothetical protein M3315_11910 [Actinomycetota bacterium]|nr:hypothetical protein [Actinomycetota bacterium]